MRHFKDIAQGIVWTLDDSGAEFWPGIPDASLDAMGEIVLVEQPKFYREYRAGEVFCVIETLKKVYELAVPCDCRCVCEGDYLRGILPRLGAFVGLPDFSGENYEEVEACEQ